MNVLLLLSALLSALTGVGAGTRGHAPNVAVERRADAVEAIAVSMADETAASARPVFAVPRPVMAVIGVVWRLTPTVPVRGERRRE